MTLIHVDTPSLAIACHISGPEDGAPLFLLHGWPDDASTWNALLLGLHQAGWRTITPYLRGFGPTRFHRPDTPRTGQFTSLARDLLDLADGLGIDRFSLVGHDLGARAAYSAAVLAPDRINACAALSVGWAGNDPAQPLSFTQAQAFWYQWLMALDRGEAIIRHQGEDFARHLWEIWSPGWAIPDADFALVAQSLANPDWAEVTLQSYRSRWGHAPRDPDYQADEDRIAQSPLIRVPTLVLHGADDPCNPPASSQGRESLFTGPYRRAVLDHTAHFPQRQSPALVLAQLLPFLAAHRV
jgi:pimeloyl-ACP methyl ester carboxylesterase